MRQKNLNQLNLIILIAFITVALSLIFWTIFRADSFAIRDDNPRFVEAELRIQRGDILDRNNIILATTTLESGLAQRIYPLAGMSPAIGYYSFRYGTAGIEDGLNSILRGESASFSTNFRRNVIHQPQIGQDIRLTLDGRLQQKAAATFGEEQGALLLLEFADNSDVAEIRAMVSHPNYDPNQIDEQFDMLLEDNRGPLLNRVTQGRYQPGLLLQPLLMATAIEKNLISLGSQVENSNRPILINGKVTNCATPPPKPTLWVHVLQHRCPGPMQEIGDQLGISGLDQMFSDFGFTTEPQLSIPTEIGEQLPIEDPLLSSIGQDTFIVTPLQVGLAMGALAGNGRIRQATLVTHVQDENKVWRPYSQQSSEQQNQSSVVLHPSSVRAIRQIMPQYDGTLEHNVLVLSGPEAETHSWYIGIDTGETATLEPAETAVYVIIVVIENNNLNASAKKGRELLQAIHAP